jgi:hypothetical protein
MSLHKNIYGNTEAGRKAALEDAQAARQHRHPVMADLAVAFRSIVREVTPAVIHEGIEAALSPGSIPTHIGGIALQVTQAEQVTPDK